MIVVSLAERNVKELLASAKACDGKADIIEARLDFLQDLSGISALKDIKLPLICTCRPTWELGKFKGSEMDRMRVLNKAVEFCEFIDIELSSFKKDSILSIAEEEGVVSIVSKHYSDAPGLNALEKDLKECNGDIAKIVPMAKQPEESISILKFAHKHPGTIAFCSGMGGIASRFLSLGLGNPFMYTCLNEQTAPGQLQVDTALKVLKKMKGKKFPSGVKGVLSFEKEFLH